MDLQHPLPLRAIAELVGGEIIGDPETIVSSINEIHKVKRGSLTFVDVKKYYDRALYSAATVIIVNDKVDCPPGKALLLCDDPFYAYNKLATTFKPFKHLTATISDSAVIGDDTVIEPGVVIGHNVTIGSNCLIRANVVIMDDTVIGNNVTIHPNTTIGSDAFYFKKQGDVYEGWHSIGRVVIHDDVRIGACCSIDKGVSGDTIIGKGSKLDNQVHIAHGVVVGQNCLFAAQVGVAGKTIIQDNVTLYGQVGVSKSLVIGEGAIVLAQSGVSKSLMGGKTYFGSPAGESKQKYLEMVAIRGLPDFFKKYNEEQKREHDDQELFGNSADLTIEE